MAAATSPTGRFFGQSSPFYFITFNTYSVKGVLARDEVHEAFCIFFIKAQSMMSRLVAMS